MVFSVVIDSQHGFLSQNRLMDLIVTVIFHMQQPFIEPGQPRYLICQQTYFP